MPRKKESPSPATVIPALPLAEVWAVATYMPDCHADDCYCGEGVEGSAVVGLFASEQTARQFADRKNNGREYGPYRAQKMPVHTAMTTLY